MSEHTHHDHHHDHGHGHDHGSPAPAPTPIDPGSQALAEALRSSFAIVKVVMFLLIVVFLASGFFQVGPQEQAIILRFGKPVGEGQNALLGPGWHWSWPYPIDEYVKIPITGLQQVRSTVGWYATTDVQEAAGTEPPPGPSLNPAIDGYVLTADGNIIHSRATLYFRIEDPIRYELGVTNALRLVQNALNNALVQTATRFKVDDILMFNVAGFNEAVAERVRELLNQQNLGVAVDRCVTESIAPRQLKAVFEQVVSAGQKQRTVLDEARKYSNQALSRSGADAKRMIDLAETERDSYVKEITSLAATFDQLVPMYNQNPELFLQRELSQRLGRSLTNAEKWVVPESVNGKSQNLWLNLNREPQKPKTEQPTP